LIRSDVYGFGWLDDELVAVAAEKQVIIEVDD
jgi:hypothetical protein